MAECASRVAKVLKVPVDWIGSLEMECGRSPFWGRPEAGRRGHCASYTVHFSVPFYSAPPLAPEQARVQDDPVHAPRVFLWWEACP